MRRGLGFHGRRGVGGSLGQSSSFPQGSLVGSGVTFTSTRAAWSGTGAAAGSGTVIDQDGVIRTALVNEARFQGLRRVQNILSLTTSKSEVVTGSWSTAGWNGASVTLSGNNIAYGAQFSNITHGGVTGMYVVGHTYRVTMDAQINAGNTTLSVATSDGVNITSFTGSLGVRQKYSIVFTKTTSAAAAVAVMQDRNASGFGNADLFSVQVEDVTGQSNQNPADYVSVGVLSSPWNGAGVDGVKYFATQNGNTVTANVVTAGTGAAITGGALLDEPNASTNYFQQSAAPATHTTTGNLPTGTYTLWMDGTGSVAVAGATATITGAGVATAGSNVTFVVTVTGTVLFTVVGSPTRAQAESFAGRSSYIPTTTGPVTRAADAPAVATSGLLVAAQGSVAMVFTPQSVIAAAGRLMSSFTAAAEIYLYSPAGTKLSSFSSADSEKDFLSAQTFTVGVQTKVAMAYAGTTQNGAKDGVAGTAQAYTATSPGTNIQLLADPGGGNPGPNALIYSVTFNSVTPSSVASATI